MTTIPAPKLVLTHEEWPDADFDLPEGEPIHSVINRDDDPDEDWDMEMDLGSTGGAKVQAVTGFTLGSSGSSHKPQLFNIRPPQPQPISDADDDDEGVSTIKASAVLPKPVAKIPQQTPIEEDMETAFALPDDLTQLSLAPLSLNHRSSKNSLEWGDKDHTSSSQSSDAYSSLSFADASPSNSASSVSQPDTGDELETDEDDEGVLDGLLIPTGLFDTGHSGRKLNRILEMKKKVGITDTRVKIASPDPEDDFEMGLVIGDDVDLSPSRLLLSTHQNKYQLRKSPNRSTSAPPRRPAPSLRPPSRLKHERAKSPINPPPSSTRQLQKLRLTPSPPLRGAPVRAQTFQALSPAPTPPTSFLSPKPGSLRGQKSHSGLKPPTPPSTTRMLSRKASLSSLMETSQPQPPGLPAPIASGSKARYEEATYASRAKSHKNTTSRIHDYKVPPTRPCTPSSNQAALRLTMPTQRSKSRPALSTVWGTVNAPDPSTIRSSSPLPPPRPPSSLSLKSQKPSGIPQPVAPKVLRRPKRQRTYGDGTELDSIEDLPADREKEARYRVQPKGYGNRIPGGTYPSKAAEKGTIRKKGRREASDSGQDHIVPPLPPTNSLKRTTSRIDALSKTELPLPKKKRNVSSPTIPGTRRKPTLIRNLGGAGAPKVVGDMKWNPQSLRWEGNDHVLRDFDAVVGTSTRPALITHLTGSSIGSPVGSFASGARIVGNMIFDPSRMCWISTLPPEEDEPDVFANLADDEEDAEDWETKGGTIRASLQGKDLSSSDAVAHTASNSSNASSEAPSPSCSRTRAMSDSGSDRGSRASMVCEVDDTFLLKCRQAEERHRTEMKGWKATLSKATEASEPDRSYLYEIRALATRKY